MRAASVCVCVRKRGRDKVESERDREREGGTLCVSEAEAARWLKMYTLCTLVPQETNLFMADSMGSIKV